MGDAKKMGFVQKQLLDIQPGEAERRACRDRRGGMLPSPNLPGTPYPAILSQAPFPGPTVRIQSAQAPCIPLIS